VVVGEASSTTSPGFAAQEVLPSLVQEGFQSQAGDLSTSDGDTPRQVPVGPGPEQPPTVLVGGVGIAGSIAEMMPADGNAATAALFLQEELTIAAPEEGVPLVIPRVETVAEEIPRVGLKVPAAQPEVLGADILKPTTIHRSSRSKAKADEHTLQKTERMAAKKNLESPGTSFTSFFDSRIVSNLGKVSINLGSSDDIVKASTVSIKNLEIDKLVVHANKKG